METPRPLHDCSANSTKVPHRTEQSSLLEQGHWFALNGDIKNSFQAYSRAFRIGPVEKETLSQLVSALVKTTTNHKLTDEIESMDRGSPATGNLCECAVCQALLFEPVTLSCGHTYCKSCLADRQPPNSSVCCRDALTNETVLKVNVLLAAVVKNSAPSSLVEREELKLKGRKLLLEGQTDEAKECFSVVLESFPGDVTALCWRCDANMKLGCYELALQDAEVACKLYPDMIKALYRKADALMRLQKPEEAVFAYLRCKSIVPWNEVCNEKLSAALAQLFSPPEYIDIKKSISPHKVSSLGPSDARDLQETTSDDNAKHKAEYKEHPMDERHDHQSEKSEGRVKRDDLECKLCYSLLYQPVTTPCGHSFCRDCLNRSLDHRTECPCCRTALTTYLAQRNTNVTLLLETLVKKHFQAEYLEREKRHLKELDRLSRVGHDDDVEVPIFSCTVAFPTVQCPLHIFEPKYRLMIRRCVESGSCQFGMCLSSSDPERPSYADYGTMLEIGAVDYLVDGRSIIQTVGGRRFQVVSRGMTDGYNTAKVKWLSDEDDEDLEDLAHLNVKCYGLLQTWFHQLTVEQKNCVASALGPLPACESAIPSSPHGPSWVWWALASLPLQDNFKVIILGMTSLRERLISIQRFLCLMIQRLNDK